MNAKARTLAGERAAWAPGRVLGATGVRPSRARGQNFLVQPALADRIVAAADLAADDTVVEIGPGLGILSERIASHRVRRLYLVEVDAQLVASLRTRFAPDKRVRVIESDFLDLELEAVAEGARIKVIGNLPFNAAAAILRRLCEQRATIAAMVLMFQREVAERIRARPGERGHAMLSVISALYWKIGAHFRVGSGNFYPKPKVEAEVLVMSPLPVAPFEPGEERAVLATVRAAFSTPRKMIRNALGGALRIEPAQIAAALARARIASDARAETLAAADLVRLARALELRPHDA